MKKLIQFTTASLCLAIVSIATPFKANSEVTGPCLNPGDYLADNIQCNVYYICDAFLYPVRYSCPGSLVFAKTTNTCVANRSLAECEDN